MTIREAIDKFEIRYSNYNTQTRQKGDFLQVEKSKITSQIDSEFIKNNKQAIIEEIKKIKSEKELQEKKQLEEKIKSEKEKYINNNEQFEIGITFTNWGSGIYGLPIFLKDKEEMLIKAKDKGILSFPMNWEGFDPLKINYTEIIEIEKKLNDMLDKQKKDKEVKEKKHYEKCLAEAKEKNERVVLYQISDECNDPREECNIDTITTFLYPNGRKETIRSHTW